MKLENICPAYCDCEFPKCTEMSTYNVPHITDSVKCRCGEEDSHRLEWQWAQPQDSDIAVSGADVTFHPIYSQGTAIVRGSKPLKSNAVHFWEVRIITVLTGTDVMFGIGTDKVDLNEFKFHFVSALGTNSQSWGYSYGGKIQHNGVRLTYGQKFSQGCILGIYFDRARGYLEYFLNRRSLGIAYTNIPTDPSVKIYPMVSSTAAKCIIRLINSTSQPECLQLRAFKAISSQPKALQELQQMPGLRSIMQSYWFLAPPVRYSSRSAENEYDIADEAVLSSKLRLSRKQKFKDDDADINDLYSNAHRIALHRKENDEEYSLNEYFDEYFHYLF